MQKQNENNLCKIKKINLMKLIKFSKIILISNNKINFLKESLNKDIIKKEIFLNEIIDNNYFLYITKDIKKELDKLSSEVKINIEDGFIFFNNIKIELIKAVVKI